MPLQAYVSPVAAPARGCRRPDRRSDRGPGWRSGRRPDRRSGRDYIRQTAHRRQRRIAREGVRRREEARNRGAPPQKGHRTGSCPDRHKASEAAQAPARQRLGRSGCPPPRHKPGAAKAQCSGYPPSRQELLARHEFPERHKLPAPGKPPDARQAPHRETGRNVLIRHTHKKARHPATSLSAIITGHQVQAKERD